MSAQSETWPRTISIRYELDATPAKVWRALTEPELLARWLMSTDMKPVVGQQFTFRADPTPWWDGIVRCEILDSEPEKLLRYRWRGSKPDDLDTIVTWRLTPTSTGKTLLELEHSGFQPPEAPFYEGASQGWRRMVMEKLPEVLASAA
jgi:uncharacterized protein YndB with AHSA1/START domain